MKLVKKFYLKDIRDYEDENNANIIHFFDNMLDLNSLVELIKIGNRVDTDTACSMLQEYLNEPENNLITAYEEVRDALLGKQPTQDDDSNLETKEYESLTELFNDLCKQILSMGISYSEFWGMSTKEMYKVAEGLQDKQIQEFNSKQDEMYMQAVMVGQAVWGKIRQPRHIEIEDPNETIYTEEFGELTRAEYNTIKALGGFDKEGNK